LVQAALAVALVVAAATSYRAVETHAQHRPASVRLGLPLLFIGGALVCAGRAWRNGRRAAEERAIARGAAGDAGDEHSRQ
jgi:hypothetical protein